MPMKVEYCIPTPVQCETVLRTNLIDRRGIQLYVDMPLFVAYQRGGLTIYIFAQRDHLRQGFISRGMSNKTFHC